MFFINRLLASFPSQSCLDHRFGRFVAVTDLGPVTMCRHLIWFGWRSISVCDGGLCLAVEVPGLFGHHRNLSRQHLLDQKTVILPSPSRCALRVDFWRFAGGWFLGLLTKVSHSTTLVLSGFMRVHPCSASSCPVSRHGAVTFCWGWDQITPDFLDRYSSIGQRLIAAPSPDSG